MASSGLTKNLSALIELPESGRLEYAQRATLTKLYGGLYTVCVAGMQTNGTIGTGETAGFYVERSTVTRERGDQGRLEIVWVAAGAEGGGGGGITVPQDQASCIPENLSIAIQRHPRYASLATATLTEGTSTWTILELVDSADRASDKTERELWVGRLSGGATGALALELYRKLVAGQRTYYYAGIRYTWISFSWNVPDLALGGYIDTPTGPLAGYLPPTAEWLRECDALDSADGIYRVTRTWIGAPENYFDAELYAA